MVGAGEPVTSHSKVMSVASWAYTLAGFFRNCGEAKKRSKKQQNKSYFFVGEMKLQMYDLVQLITSENDMIWLWAENAAFDVCQPLKIP